MTCIQIKSLLLLFFFSGILWITSVYPGVALFLLTSAIRETSFCPTPVLAKSKFCPWQVLSWNSNHSAPSWTQRLHLPTPAPLPHPQISLWKTQLGSYCTAKRRSMSMNQVCRLHSKSSQPPTEMQRPLLVMLHAYIITIGRWNLPETIWQCWISSRCLHL